MSGKPAARLGDAVASGKIVSGSATVLIGDTGEGAADRCPVCEPAVGGPVNPLLGVKLLPAETDFALAAPSVFAFSRGYVSNDTRGGVLGPGWTIPGDSISLTADAAATLLTDAQGRCLRFGPLAPGESRFSGSEGLWLRRGGPVVPQAGALEPWAGRWGWVPAALQHDPDTILVRRGTHAVHFARHGARWLAVAEFDANGYRTVFGRSDEGLIRHVLDSAGRCYLFIYTRPPDCDGLRLAGVVLAARDGSVPAGCDTTRSDTDWLVRYDYSAAGELTAVRDRAGQVVRRFTWTLGQLSGHEIPGGTRVSYEWDGPAPHGRVVVQREAGGLTRHYAYHDGYTEISDSLGRSERYHFSGHGGEQRWSAHARADGSRVSFDHDAFGRRVATTDALGRTTRTRRDGAGRVIGTLAADGACWRYTLDDDSDLPIRIEDPEGRRWTIERDVRAHPRCVTAPDGATTRYAYADPRLPDRPTTIIDARGGEKQLAWNALGQLTAWTDCSGHTTRRAYDADGHLVRHTDAAGATTTFTRDVTGRVRCVTFADGSAVHTDYDGQGRALRRRMGDHTTTWHYDRHGRLARVSDAAGRELHYRYDAAGRLVELENENGAITRFTYDALDRLAAECGFDGRSRHYRYNAAGELVAVVEPDEGGEADERITRYAYDATGRLVARELPATAAAPALTERWRWNRSGQLLAAESPAARLGWHYDAAGRLALETQAHPDGWRYTVAHRYNEAGVREATRYDEAPEVAWLTYGPGHLHGVAVDALTLDFARDALHREVGRRARAADTELFAATRTWDAVGRLADQHLALSGRTWQRRYGYAATGWLTAVADSLHGALAYTYDPAGRLVASRHGTRDYRYAFDAAGNRCDLPTAPHATPAGSPDNRLASLAGTHYRYDVAGNLVERVAADGTRLRLHYDGAHRLVRLEREHADGSRSTAHYRYDALSRRIAKSVTTPAGNTTTRFGWDGERQVAEEDTDGVRTTVFEPDSFVPLLRLAQRRVRDTGEEDDDDTAALDAARALFTDHGLALPEALRPRSHDARHIALFHTDHLGTPLLLTDTTGEVLWQARPDDWGAVRDERGDTDQPLRFQGQYRDAESGLCYNRYRYYDPHAGRYVTQDPIGLMGGLNAYKYTSNPVSRLDPLGLSDALYENTSEPYERPPLRPDGRPWGEGCGDAATDHVVPDGIGKADFSKACGKEVGHDGCYGTWGSDKEACDAKLEIDMKAACDNDLKGLHILYKPMCKAMGTFYRFVLNDMNMGESAFYAAQEEAFWKMIEEKQLP